MRSPKIMAHDHKGCNYEYDTAHVEDMTSWLPAIQHYSFPTHYIYPFEEKFRYPANKRRTRQNVIAMQQAEANLDSFWVSIDAMSKSKTGMARHPLIQKCLDEGGEMHRTTPWVELPAKNPIPVKKQDQEYQPFSRMVHNKAMQITGSFDKISIEEKNKTKTRGTTDQAPISAEDQAPQQTVSHQSEKPFLVDKSTHKVFKTMFYTPTTNTGDLPRAVTWADFKRAMAHVGFAVERLQGSAWQFTPGTASNAERNIQFHEPHPDSDVPYIMAKRYGRRLGRVYGWDASTVGVQIPSSLLDGNVDTS